MHRSMFLVGGLLDPVVDDDATLRQVYDEHRAAIWRDERPFEAPFGFWLFDKRVPEHLRATREEAGAVPLDALDQRERLGAERAEWLRAVWDDEQPFGGLA
jgi:hypothetical protein